MYTGRHLWPAAAPNNAVVSFNIDPLVSMTGPGIGPLGITIILFYLLVFGGAIAAVVFIVRALQRIADAQENTHRVLQDIARLLERDGEPRSSSEPGAG